MLGDALVCGTDDLSSVCQFFDSVGTPAYHTGDGEDRGEKLWGKIQHAVHEAAVEVYIGADAFIDAAFFADDNRCKPFYHGIEVELLFPSFFHCELLHKGLEDICTGIGDGVNGMPHSIDQPCMVKGFLMEKVFQVIAYFILVRPILDNRLHILEHLYNLDVGAAVLWPFQGA